MTCSACNPQHALTVTRGESKTFLVTVRDSQRNLIDLTSASVWFTVKNRLEDPGATIAKKNVTAGGVDGQILVSLPQVGAVVGQFKIFIVPADTTGIDPEAALVCDAWVQVASGQRYQVISNRQFKILPAVTTAF
jgi:hypothetical protein